MTLTGLLVASFAIYVGVEYYACPLDQSGGSYGFVKNTDARLTSAIGIIQVTLIQASREKVYFSFLTGRSHPSQICIADMTYWHH